MGAVGNYIVLTEYVNDALNAKMVKIDGKKYKANVWYGLRGGKIVEC
jgi:hypothetical protein